MTNEPQFTAYREDSGRSLRPTRRLLYWAAMFLLIVLASFTASAQQYGDFLYAVESNNTVSITQFIGSGNDVFIPPAIQGKPVVTIGEDAFRGCAHLTTVTIPDSVESIEVSAFRDCTGLERLTIPGGVSSIGDYAFSDCITLTSVTIGDNVVSIGDYAFDSCGSLTNVSIPDSVTSIGIGAFDSCGSLASVTLGNSVVSIGGAAFRLCASLTNVTIPDSVLSIGGTAFGLWRHRGRIFTFDITWGTGVISPFFI